MNKLTIQQQLARRHDCRYGLRGLQCRLAGDDTPYRILDRTGAKTACCCESFPPSGGTPIRPHQRPRRSVAAAGSKVGFPSSTPPPWATGRNRKVSA